MNFKLRLVFLACGVGIATGTIFVVKSLQQLGESVGDLRREFRNND